MDTTSIRMPVPETVDFNGYAAGEESLVTDSRAGLTPSQMVGAASSSVSSRATRCPLANSIQGAG